MNVIPRDYIVHGSIGSPPKQDSSQMIPPTEVLPTRTPPKLDSSQRTPSKTGILPKQDSSQDGIPLRWDSYQDGIPLETGGVPLEGFQAEGVPREESCFLLCKKIHCESFRSDTRS